MDQRIFVLDNQMKCVGVLDNSVPRGCPFFDDTHTESLEHALLTFEFSVPASHELAEFIEPESFIVYPNMDNRFELFQVKEVTESNKDGQYVKNVFAENAAISDLIGNVVRPATLNSYSIQQAVNYVLSGTDWTLGEIYTDDVKDVVFDDYTNSLEALHQVMDLFGCEIEWAVEFKGLQVVKKVVNVYKQRGTVTKKLFTYGVDLVGVERTEDTKELYTAIIGLSNGDGYGNYLTLRNYTGTVPEGYELKEDWLGSLEALERFGRNGKHIIGVYRFDGLQNATELFNKTLEKLNEVSKPKLTYTVDVALLERITGYEAHKVRVGDTIVIKDETFKPALILEARVLELKRSKTDPSKDSVTLGEYRPIIATPVQQIQKLQAKLMQYETVWTSGADTAQQALQIAQQAQTTADQAQTVATDAQTTAQQAQSVATGAQTTAQQVQGTVDGWKHPADTTKIDGGAIYTGSLTADTIRGGTLTLGGISNGYGKLIILRDDETPVAQLDAQQGGFDVLNVGTLISPSIVQRNISNYTIYVDPIGGSDANSGLGGWTNAKKTLQSAFDMLPKFNEGIITILVKSGTNAWSESSDLYLKGIHGNGQIIVDFQDRAQTLQGRVKVLHCTNYILFQNGTVKNLENFASNQWYGCIHVEACSRVHFKNMYVDARAGSKLQYCISAFYNSYVRVEGCEAYNGAKAQVVSAYGSTIDFIGTGCIGSGGEYGAYVVGGALLGGTGNCPTGTLGDINKVQSGYCDATFTFTPGTPPAGGSTSQTTKVWNAIATKSWRDTYGWRSDNDYIYQGEYSTYGNHIGFMFFDYGNIQSTLAGKTIKSVRLYLSRRPGGTLSAQPINIYTHNYTTSIIGQSNPTAITLIQNNVGSYAVGDKKFITLPVSIGNSFKSGTIKGLALHAPSGSPYCIFDGLSVAADSCQLEITYEG